MINGVHAMMDAENALWALDFMFLHVNAKFW
jgi:hypothetical protein